MTIKEIFRDILTDAQRAQLLSAFEQGITQYVEFDEGWFIGVNRNTDFKIIEEGDNGWFLGTTN